VCKVFIDEMPAVKIVGGMVHITRADGECEVWPFEVFEAFMFAGMEVVTAWRGRQRSTGTVLPFKK
jgi:hypothetical protein